MYMPPSSDWRIQRYAENKNPLAQFTLIVKLQGRIYKRQKRYYEDLKEGKFLSIQSNHEHLIYLRETLRNRQEFDKLKLHGRSGPDTAGGGNG